MLQTDRGSFELARNLRGIAVGSTTPLLPDSISETLEEHNYDPLRLAIAGASGPTEIVGHLLPVELLKPQHEKSNSREGAKPDFNLADAHLHSGASMGLETFVRASVRLTGNFPDSLRDVVSYDHVGDAFSLGVIVAAIRQFIQLIRSDASVLAPPCPTSVAEAWHNGKYWSHTRLLAVGVLPPSRPETQFAEAEGTYRHWRDLAAIYPADNSNWDPVDEVRRYIQTSVELGGPQDRSYCSGLVAALCLINSFLRSSPGEGLPSFVDRFDQMGLLRDAAIADDRAESVAAATDFIMAEDRVVGAEFRKSIFASRKSTYADLETKIAISLADHLKGFSTSDAVARCDRRLAMPVTFLRSESQVPSDVDPSLLHDLAPLWRLTSAIEKTSQQPEIGRFINAVDVVGNEFSTPNWVFVPLLDALGQTPNRLTRSCHAGESFVTRVQGLRSIGELLLPNPVVERIGHALALDELVSDFIIGRYPSQYFVRDAIEDMCWLIASGIATDAAREFLSMLLGAANITSCGLDVENFIRAWQARRSLDGYAQFELSKGLADPPARSIDSSISRLADGDHLAFLLLTHHSRRFPFNALDGPLVGALADEYRGLEKDLCEEISAEIQTAIKESNVTIEACPTSNLRLAGLPKATYLPIAKWLNNQMRVSLNSDDPLIFGTSIVAEERLVLDNFTPDVLERLASHSVEACCIGLPAISVSEYTEAAATAKAKVPSKR